jgi:isopentenyl-diphosphate Delta-isomerase
MVALSLKGATIRTMIEPNDTYEVLDEHGVATGKILDRKIVHQRGLWHAVANVWVMNNRGELLMQLRAPGVELSPNVWDVSVGTHVRLHEPPAEAGARALQTELGVQVPAAELKHLFNILSPNPMPDGSAHRVLGHVFMVQRDLKLSDFTLDAAKVSKLAWVPLTQLMADIGSSETSAHYFPRANNYYPQLFKAFQSWM